MAGNVTGELGGQPIFLENAATEATLEALLQATLANSSNKSQAAKIQKAYEESVKKTTDNQKSNIDSLKKQTDTINKEKKNRDDLNEKLREEKEARQKTIQGLAEFGQFLGNTLGKGLGIAFNTATPKISDFTNALSGIPIIGPIIGALGNALQAETDRFRELSAVGADFGVGLTGIREVAKEAGLSLDTFTNAITSNSKSLALLGGSTTAGAKIFGAVNKSLQGPFQEGLARLGFTMDETAEYTAGYLSQQTRLGNAQRMTQTQLNEGAKEYLLELDKLARVTGMSRKEAQAALDKQTEDKRLVAMYAAMEKGGSDVAKFLIAGFGAADKDMGDALMDLVANNGIPMTEMAQSIALTNPELKELAMRIRNETATKEDGERVAKIIGQRSTERLAAEGKNISLLKAQGVTVFDSVIAGSKLTNAFKGMTEEEKKQAQSKEDSRLNALNLDKSLLEVRNKFMTALLPVMELFTTMLTNSAPAIEKFATKIAEAIESFMKNVGDKGLGAAIFSAIGDVLSNGFIALFKSSPVITGLVLAITALFAAAKVKQAIDVFRPGSTGPDIDTGKGKGKFGKFAKGAAISAAIAGTLGYATDAGLGALGVGKNVEIDEKADDRNWEKASVGEKMQSAIPRGIEKIGSLFFLDNLVKEAKADRIAKETAYINSKEGTPKTPADTAGPIPPQAVEVAKTTTAKEVRELSEALKTLDYGKLLVDDKIVTSMETGTLKMRQLRGEVGAMSLAFKELNNVGLDKITEGLGRLDASFKGFSKSFAEDFMTKFRELDKKSQETLLTDLNDKMEQLNTNVKSLITLQEENTRYGKDTSRNTKYASGRV
jgi:hypothetical protein